MRFYFGVIFRSINLHARSQNGFMDDATLSFKIKSNTEDYHGTGKLSLSE